MNIDYGENYENDLRQSLNGELDEEGELELKIKGLEFEIATLKMLLEAERIVTKSIVTAWKYKKGGL